MKKVLFKAAECGYFIVCFSMLAEMESYAYIDPSVTTYAIQAIAEMSLERKTGARGLRAIMENTLMDLMYRIPSDETIARCTVTREAVEHTGEPLIEYKSA